jgi:hypothetical protein
MDYLNAGQTLKQLYDVTISDGHGGTVVQTITITLRGSSDGTLFGRGNGPDAFDWKSPAKEFCARHPSTPRQSRRQKVLKQNGALRAGTSTFSRSPGPRKAGAP